MTGNDHSGGRQAGRRAGRQAGAAVVAAFLTSSTPATNAADQASRHACASCGGPCVTATQESAFGIIDTHSLNKPAVDSCSLPNERITCKKDGNNRNGNRERDGERERAREFNA